MTDDPIPSDVDLGRGEASLHLAIQQMRTAHESRAVEIADSVLARSLAAPRRARLIRAAAPYDYLRVSTLVVIATLRERLDAAMTGAAVGHIVCDVSKDEELTGLTIELYVQFGENVLDLGDEARHLAHTTLTDLLAAPGSADEAGPAQPPRVSSHVHVSDVTVGDPLLVEPNDEP